MKRWVGAILTVLSLIAFVIVVAVCVRSFFVFDSAHRSNYWGLPMNDAARAYAKSSGYDIKFISHGEGFGVQIWRGHLTLMHGVLETPTSRWDDDFEKKYVNRPNWSVDEHTWNEEGYEPAGNPNLNNVPGWLGFGDVVQKDPSKWVSEYRWLTLPLWPAVLVTGFLPVRWWRRRAIVRKRWARGLCIACGYDLRASERCPECGAVPMGK